MKSVSTGELEHWLRNYVTDQLTENPERDPLGVLSFSPINARVRLGHAGRESDARARATMADAERAARPNPMSVHSPVRGWGDHCRVRDGRGSRKAAPRTTNHPAANGLPDGVKMLIANSLSDFNWHPSKMKMFSYSSVNGSVGGVIMSNSPTSVRR
jgi:hypothetical protein